MSVDYIIDTQFYILLYVRLGINYLEHKVDENFISKGCYKFSVEKNNNPNLSYETMPFLTLTYKTDEDGKLTNENISASSHKFNLIGPSSAIYSILNKYLGVDWDQLSKFVNIRSDIALAPTMQMQEEGTEYVVNGDVTLFPQIPENILK